MRTPSAAGLKLGARVAGVALAAALLWFALLPGRAATQPIEFSHRRHNGVTCQVCHAGVRTTARAMIPDVVVCAKCHATPPATVNPPLWDAAVKRGSLQWNRVTHVPSHVLFSHRSHVAIARLDCPSCHAQVGISDAPPRRAPLRLDMNACLSCHTREGASTDCLACHR